MDSHKAIQLLKEQLQKIVELKKPPAYNPQYKIWNNTTLKILESAFGDDVVELYKSTIQTQIAMSEEHHFHLYLEVLDEKKKLLEGIISEYERFQESEPSFSGSREAYPSSVPLEDQKRLITKDVFIIHGHDSGTKETVARFISKLGLNPVILHEQSNLGRTIIEKFEDYSDASYAIALLTPDDHGSSINEKDNLNPRARQNVIFEFGYFIGKLGRERVCGLKKGYVEIPSDYSGVIYIDFDDSGAWKIALVKELKAVGFDVDADLAL